MQLHQPSFLKEIAALDATILVVSFAPMPRLQEWVPFFETYFLEPSYQEQGLTTEGVFDRTRFLSNPDLSVYHAYGLDRNSVREVYSLKILRQYARWKAQGRPVNLPSEDALQRGGNFVVNRAGFLTLSHTGRNQSERPSPEEILKALLQP